MPLMVNIRGWLQGSFNDSLLGSAAAYYLPDDLYVPRRFVERYPTAIAFVYVKGTPGKLYPVYTVQEAVDRVWRGDKENVRLYLTDHEARERLEPTYIGPFVAEARHARLPPRKQGEALISKSIMDHV
jgi:hypothetical protein